MAQDSPGHIGPSSALADGAKKLVEHASKQAGWLPLLGLVTIAVEFFNVRLPRSLGHLTFPTLPDEVAIGLTTFALFHIGDVLDKVVFKRREANGNEPKRWPDEYFATAREADRQSLELGSGSYAAALGLVEGSDEGRTWLVYLTNESAKFLRSLVLPLLAMVVWQLFSHRAYVLFGASAFAFVAACAYFRFVHSENTRRSRRTVAGLSWVLVGVTFVGMLGTAQYRAALLALSAALALLSYLFLKHTHIRSVYANAREIRDNDTRRKFSAVDLATNGKPMRLVFWDGKLVGSAVHEKADPNKAGRGDKAEVKPSTMPPLPAATDRQGART